MNKIAAMAALIASAHVSTEALAQNLRPVISISRDVTGSKITFTGRLQAANSLAGPWEDLLSAGSPYLTQDGEESRANRFYRAREASGESIFSSAGIVDLTVSGPFQTYFEAAYAGTPDGIFPPKREKPYFDGVVQLGGTNLPVSFRVRGNSSLQECPFPKLKFKVSKEQRPGTPFFDAREIKIGTHCAEGGRGNIGRLRDQIAAYREALAYETMAALGFTAPRVRRARIEYHDTSPTNEFSTTGWALSREALIFDDVEVVAERLGGRALDDEEIEALTDARFDEQQIVELKLFHALLGNWDFGLSVDGRELWNTDVIELADGSLIPMIGDFDLSSWVTEKARLNAPSDYHPELGDVEREASYTVEELRRASDPAVFAAAKERFVAKRSTIEALVNAANVDEDGRANALRHITAFFSTLVPVKR